ncbi:MAG TPA: PHP domain-containing protein [Thermotogota bacterium]|nr:PHP domain-containing protein [Thermotogota bacterium]HRW33983.1 PHP domain-containing protein [Thermotogota bacterium]
MLKWKGSWKLFKDSVNAVFDLHLHTTYSDGEQSPEGLLKILKANQVTHFALTDHDNMAPFDDIKRAALEAGMHVVPGIEISSVYKDVEVHILGYCFDWRFPLLRSFIEERLVLRKERALLIIERLQNKGYLFSAEDFEKLMNRRYVGRPQIAQLLFEYGYVSDPKEAFTEAFIGDTSCKAITYQLKTVEEALTIIKQAGGLAFLAHPGLFSSESNQADGMNKYDLMRFVEMGINGIEVFHPRHSKSQIQRYISFIANHQLLLSMGTDYHRGCYKPNTYAFNWSNYTKDVLSWIV